NEAYMATWFYGLVHELGHLYPGAMQHLPEGLMFSDAWMLDAITCALDKFPSYSVSLKQEAIERAKQHRSLSVLGIDQVRGEGLADIFAASVLLQTTSDTMREINQERFQIIHFIAEMMIFLNIIGFIERCRGVASDASAKTPDRNVVLENTLHPVSMVVRAIMQRVYLDWAVT